jgi:hypothetical protein
MCSNPEKLAFCWFFRGKCNVARDFGFTVSPLGDREMLGLFAMLLVLLAVAAVLSYWVSWELENKNTRPNFFAKAAADLGGLFGRGGDKVAETRPASA